MLVLDSVRIMIEGKGEYENLLDDHGYEHESLNGVGLMDGHYCKHYRRARHWSDKKNVDDKGIPVFQHYCNKHKRFDGWAYCCMPGCSCFEQGKSAGVKRIRANIQKHRIFDEKYPE